LNHQGETRFENGSKTEFLVENYRA
jgi:hypothetical protein